MPQAQNVLKRTPLYQEHLALGAGMAPFGGWEMPIQYYGIIAEAAQARGRAAVFDTCHMGELFVRGDCVSSGLDRIIPARLKDMPFNTCRYSAMLDEKGGIIDDLVVYRQAEDEWLIVVNAANINKDAEHIRTSLTDKALFEDLSSSLGKIDLQGPRSRDALRRLSGADTKSAAAAGLGYYTFGKFSLLGEDVIVSRTGYTGELGYEIYCPSPLVAGLWKRLLNDPDVKPAGLGARDILRLEMGYNLYGMDIDGETTPLEAGLARHMDFGKDFIGRGALMGQKDKDLSRKRAFFIANSRRAPRHGYKIFAGSREIGVVTSGTFSPGLERGIGMGFVTPGYEKAGTAVCLKSGAVQVEAETAVRPFYKKGSLRA